MVICAAGVAETNTVPALGDRFVTTARLTSYAGGPNVVLAPLYLSAAITPKSCTDRFVC
jgi:hypothetical protein